MHNTLVKENQYVKLIILRLWEQTPVPLFVFEELMSVVAVRERFELPDPFGSSVFKTDGLSHSPTLPFTDALHSESAHIHLISICYLLKYPKSLRCGCKSEQSFHVLRSLTFRISQAPPLKGLSVINSLTDNSDSRGIFTLTLSFSA